MKQKLNIITTKKVQPNSGITQLRTRSDVLKII